MKSRPTDPAQLVQDDNPFPGLRSFEPDEDHLFFGRETQVDRLLALLRRTRFLAVVGASGSGKSSLVRSGLVPSLYSGYMTSAGSSWRVAIFRPGEDPIGNLATALAEPDVLTPETAEVGAESQAVHRGLMEATLRRGDLGLVECRRLAPIPPQDNLLVITDQFEELFRFKENRMLDDAAEASAAFVKLLLAAASQEDVPVYVVLTMRSEFVGHCTEFVGFAEAMNQGYYLVPRMSRQERREAIVGPVMVAGGEISPRLVTRMLNDVGDDPDQLPILQHALMRTWNDHRARDGRHGPIDVHHYEAVGTLEEALSRHAEEAFEDLEEEQQELAGRLFKALTDTGTSGRRVRSPRRLDELCELAGASRDEIVAVIEVFRRPGRAFLMPPHGTPLDADSIIDISHESLMRVWVRLRAWVEEEARSAQIYLRLAKAAERHQRGEAGLWRDPELQTALNWQDQTRPNERWAERYDPSFVRAVGFLDASRRERDQQLRRREGRRRRQMAWMRRVALGAAVAALAMALLGLYALDRKAVAEALHLEALEGRREAEKERQVAVQQREIAQAQRLEAERQRKEADEQRRRAETQQQIADEQRRKAENQERAAVALRLEAEEQRAVAEARRSEAEAQRKRAEDERQRARHEESKARAARREAEIAEQRAEARRRQARAKARAEQVLRLPEHQKVRATQTALDAYRQYFEAERLLADSTRSGAYDPSLYRALFQAWRWLARDQDSDATSRYTAALDQQALWVASHHEDTVRALAVAPHGRVLASGDDAGKVSLVHLDPSEARSAIEVAALQSAVRALVWGPGATSLAAGTLDGSIRLWKISESGDGIIESWAGDICDQQEGCHLRDLVWVREERAGSARWLSADSDGTLRWWQPGPAGALTELDGAVEALLRADGEPVVELATAKDGLRLAVGFERRIQLFELRDVWRPVATLAPDLEPCGRFRSLSFDTAGSTLVAGSEDGVLFFFEIGDGEARLVARQTAHKAAITAVDFAVGQELLASASLDGSVRLWRLRQGQPKRQEPIDLDDHGGWVWDVALTAAGDRVVSGGADRKLLVRATSAEALFDDLCAYSPDDCDGPPSPSDETMESQAREEAGSCSDSALE